MPSIKTRILVISDTHCASLREQDGKAPFAYPLPSADLLIHCGDLTYKGTMDEYERTIDMLAVIDAPVKLVIAGNHDLSLDRDFVFSHMKQHNLTEEQAHETVNDARQLWTAPEGRAKQAGITLLDEGFHEINLPNGAHVNLYASPYTPEYQDWGFPYERNEDRFNSPAVSLSDATNVAPYPVPSYSSSRAPIDLLITHGPPYATLDCTNRGDFAGCEHLLRAVMRARPLLHCFGHIHEGWGAELVRWSKEADHVASRSTSIQEWRKGGWKAGLNTEGDQAMPISVDLHAAREHHGVFLDISTSSTRPIKRGSETLMVNAAIMDVSYKPVNAPFLVDIDLPTTIGV